MRLRARLKNSWTIYLWYVFIEFMAKCVKCLMDLIGHCMICKVCFSNWPQGYTFSEYCNAPYNPDTKVIPSCFGTAEDFPL